MSITEDVAVLMNAPGEEPNTRVARVTSEVSTPDPARRMLHVSAFPPVQVCVAELHAAESNRATTVPATPERTLAAYSVPVRLLPAPRDCPPRVNASVEAYELV
jgi:hypothetical protein